MDAVYGDERSNLKIHRVLTEFMAKHIRNTWKRVVYNYFLRDLSFASIELVAGVALLAFGLVFGGAHWMQSARDEIPASAGTVMISALALLSGLQLVLAFVGHDIASTPRRPVHPRLVRHDAHRRAATASSPPETSP